MPPSQGPDPQGPAALEGPVAAEHADEEPEGQAHQHQPDGPITTAHQSNPQELQPPPATMEQQSPRFEGNVDEHIAREIQTRTVSTHDMETATATSTLGRQDSTWWEMPEMIQLPRNGQTRAPRETSTSVMPGRYELGTPIQKIIPPTLPTACTHKKTWKTKVPPQSQQNHRRPIT